jgi:translation initiation factor 2-alpha kinase 4
MSSGRFAALNDSSSSDDSSDEDKPSSTPQHDDPNARAVEIPNFEDLSTSRADEELVLNAVYGSEFTRELGAWGCPRFLVQVRPPDIDESNIGSQLRLVVQLAKQYPYVVPLMELQDVKGLSKQEQALLMSKLKERGLELAKSGSVMVCDLVQVAEDFVLEYNQDPNMSAWEQMKAREAKEKEEQELQERQRETELRRLIQAEGSLNNLSALLSASQGEGRGNGGGDTNHLDVEKELARQMQALTDAQRRKKGDVVLTEAENDGEHDGYRFKALEDEDEENSDEEPHADEYTYDEAATAAVASRYKTDFIELGILGRGGGGEVVKVRNRLDRRIYAIKKIILESERGKFAKTGAIQNRKLRREVTTISRMTHKNIVGYYQAWVEGSNDDNVIEEASIEEDEDSVDDELNPDSGAPGQGREEESDSNTAWWDTAPTGQASDKMNCSSESGSSSGDSSSSLWSESGNSAQELSRVNLHAVPMEKESETDDGFGLQVSDP